MCRGQLHLLCVTIGLGYLRKVCVVSWTSSRRIEKVNLLAKCSCPIYGNVYFVQYSLVVHLSYSVFVKPTPMPVATDCPSTVAASFLQMKLSFLSALVFIPAVAVADAQTRSLRGEEEQASVPTPTTRV